MSGSDVGRAAVGRYGGPPDRAKEMDFLLGRYAEAVLDGMNAIEHLERHRHS